MDCPECILDELAEIEIYLSISGIAKMQRQVKKTDDGNQYTGLRRWVIQEKEKLWQILIDSLSSDRARYVGKLMGNALEGKQIYTMLSILETGEIQNVNARLKQNLG